MATVYATWVRYHDADSEDPILLIGIYTTRSLALQVAREAMLHEEDMYFLLEHHLNQFGPGQTIWDRHADSKSRDYRKFYQRFWPTGWPAGPCQKGE